MSERCEQTSKLMSKWPSTYIAVLGCSEPLRDAAVALDDKCEGDAEMEKVFPAIFDEKGADKEADN